MGELTRDHTNRLGRVLPFTSDDGADHPESFWVLNESNLAIGDSKGRLVVIGYHSAKAYDEGRAAIAGAKREYLITPEKWMETVFVPLPAPTEPFAVNFLLQAWAVILATKEVGEPPAEGEADTRVSFFASSVAAQ